MGSRRRWVRGAQVTLSLVVAIGIFALVIPKIASYSSVWRTLSELTYIELGSLVAAAGFNLITYYFQIVAALPGLRLGQAAVVNQSSTTIANILPGGGAIAVGVSYAILRSWGFTGADTALMMSTTGMWNSFMKLFLPVLALGLLAMTGDATTSLIIPAAIGLGLLLASLTIFAMVLWKKRLARAFGEWIGRIASTVRRLVRKPAVAGMGDRAVTFRKQTLNLVSKRWPALTVATVVSHLGLYFVLLLTLRHVGVTEQEISSVQVLAVFAFARLLSAAPITPGGVGVVELALIGGLYAAGRDSADVSLDVLKAQVTAAALLFRTLTFGIQIPLGGFTYLIWQRKSSWRKTVPATPEPVGAPHG